MSDPPAVTARSQLRKGDGGTRSGRNRLQERLQGSSTNPVSPAPNCSISTSNYNLMSELSKRMCPSANKVISDERTNQTNGEDFIPLSPKLQTPGKRNTILFNIPS